MNFVIHLARLPMAAYDEMAAGSVNCDPHPLVLPEISTSIEESVMQRN